MKRIQDSIRYVKAATLIGVMLLSVFESKAYTNVGAPPNEKPSPYRDPFFKSAGCAPATAQKDLDVNNVRTTILNGGDMWWNLSNARYEVPKITQSGQVSKNSLYAGALWIGGVTSGNLRIAAQTYRQNGNDYYPGPLTINSATITQSRCKDYDRIWKVTLSEINAFRASEDNWSLASDDMRSWPCEGKPENGEARYFAPFFDYNGDGKYNTELGDYPTFDQQNADNVPDMMLFILYNDKGSIHSETGGIPIGLEFQTHCFAYATNDAVNSMTFYRTVVFNRSNETIDSCVFGQWVDPDLGNYSDDYVECDVPRNLGICYNGDDNDEGVLGYGLNPPSVGVNFFQGPKKNDSTIIGLTKFVYYNNDWSNRGNPQRPEHYWTYLNGKWTDGTPITYGGNGKGGADTASFMFPGRTDPAGRAEWTERTAQNTPGDRRFLQTAGSFSLKPGAKNTVTIGVVWARASGGGATGSFNLLKQASDKAAVLFANNFNLITGPEAPVLNVVELNRKLVVTMTETDLVEAYVARYAGGCTAKTTFKFQGYQVYQLKTPNIPSDFYDQSQAKLVAQFDVKDQVGRLVNSINDPDLGEDVKKIMVDGADAGIKHSFEITTDLFETGSDQTLVNFKNYYFVILAYANATDCVQDPNQYLPGRKTTGKNSLVIYTAMPHDPSPQKNGTQINSNYGSGFTIKCLEGIGNGGNAIELSSGSINEALSAANGYKSITREYMPGYGPVTVKVIDPMALPSAEFHLWLRDTSANGKKADTLRANGTVWYIKNMSTGEIRQGQKSLDNDYEQIFKDWGISIQLTQSIMPGNSQSVKDVTNGYITASAEWQNSSNQWLEGVVDEDPLYSQYPPLKNPFNWIRSGSYYTPPVGNKPKYHNGETDDFIVPPPDSLPMDPRRSYSKILDGIWAPYSLSARWTTTSTTTFPSFGPAWDISSDGLSSSDNSLADLHSVNIVITQDRTLWTRCIVVETGESANLNQGGAEKMDMRKAASVDKWGRKVGDPGAINDPSNPEAANYVADSGMSWFPGYAIDIETGERLNMMFGEDSSIPPENGADMIWNPTSHIVDNDFTKPDGDRTHYGNNVRPLFGGRHYVYVMTSTKKKISGTNLNIVNTRYDEGRNYSCLMNLSCTDINSSSKFFRKRLLYAQAMWNTLPILKTGAKFDMYNGFVPSAVTIKLRVKRPYANFSYTTATVNDSMPYFSFSTNGVAPTYSKEVGKKALDKIAVVPNPYYAYSSYEDPGNQLDTRVRIVNLPQRCIIRIYTVDGVLVRTIRKDDPSTPSIDWNLKNDVNVPISSGIYLIHVKAQDLGEERIIKWFGVMRTADYDTF